MKLRNKILALICVLLFAGFGFFFYKNWVEQKPFGIVLILSDSLDSRTFAAARQFENGATNRLAMEALPTTFLLRNASANSGVASSRSAALAFSTGQIQDQTSQTESAPSRTLKGIFEMARESGRMVGVVTNGEIAGAVPSAFYAPTNSDADPAAALARAEGPDVILGGGGGALMPDIKGGTRADSRDLFLELRRDGYDIVRSWEELQNVPTWRKPRVFGIFADGRMAYRDEGIETGSQPSLADMTRRAIQLLQYNRRGYLLVVDAGLVRTAGEENRGERLLTEMLQVDAAVREALHYAGRNHLILVAGTTITGGLNLNGSPPTTDRRMALLGRSPAGTPAISWANGPGNTAGDEPSAVAINPAETVMGDVLGFGSAGKEQLPGGFHSQTIIFDWIRERL